MYAQIGGEESGERRRRGLDNAMCYRRSGRIRVAGKKLIALDVCAAPLTFSHR